MAKSPKAPLSFTSYALNKCLIGYGVVNGIINAAIFAGLHAAAEGATFDMGAVVSDLSFTGLLLGMLLFACVVPLTRMACARTSSSCRLAARAPSRSCPAPTPCLSSWWVLWPACS
ncbi:hypothetical protein ADLECEL_12400 [Adlercreutzia equolifaciens subsp. celatus]|uniref:hypothetical protein n=1 Tax=Adlercreutzia equolifaciens TaxID=446660 RepID=UPI00194E5F1E|nr:hypothetical protein [Adlercreutzia equolifaciens]BCS57355.1 hypothetical protein ADLECEL_12400 [Adlercreutzia equolifaciens subsp. celatus]